MIKKKKREKKKFKNAKIPDHDKWMHFVFLFYRYYYLQIAESLLINIKYKFAYLDIALDYLF